MEKQKNVGSIQIAMEKQLSFGRGERKRGKDSPGKRGDSQLHMVARTGNLGKVKEMLQNCGAETPKDLISKQNQEGETALYAAAENGFVFVVCEFMRHLDLQTASIAAKNCYDPFHVASKHGHFDVLKELLNAFPDLAMTTDSSNSTALHTAATQGHIHIVNLLLETDLDLAKIARNNGKIALHSAARKGHLEVVKSLLRKDLTAALRTDKKGQTALHMAVKGPSVETVLELLKSEASMLNLGDNKGNTALHIVTGKGHTQMICCLSAADGININAINKAGESPLDVAKKFGNADITAVLKESGAISSKDCGIKPSNAAKQLKQTVSDIKHDVQSQLQQTCQTRARVQHLAKRVKKLHMSGLNNAINSSTIVAVLIATIAFAAIFTVPGQYVKNKASGYSLGEAHIAKQPAFIVFLLSDSLALFISLAVVVIQMSVVVIVQKAKKQLMFVINKLMWVACICISIAFISITYIVVGSHVRWLAVYTMVVGSSIMLTTIGLLCYWIILYRVESSKLRNIRRGESHSISMSVASDPEIASSKRIYAL